MFERYGLTPTPWACLGLPPGDGARAQRPAHPPDMGPRRAAVTAIGPFHRGQLGLLLVVGSFFLLSWALSGRGRIGPVEAAAPATSIDRSATAGMLVCDEDAPDDSERPSMSFHKRPRKRRARLREEDLDRPGGGPLAASPAPIAPTAPAAPCSMDTPCGITGPARSMRSPILRC